MSRLASCTRLSNKRFFAHTPWHARLSRSMMLLFSSSMTAVLYTTSVIHTHHRHQTHTQPWYQPPRCDDDTRGVNSSTPGRSGLACAQGTRVPCSGARFVGKGRSKSAAIDNGRRRAEVQYSTLVSAIERSRRAQRRFGGQSNHKAILDISAFDDTHVNCAEARPRPPPLLSVALTTSQKT